MAPGMLEPDQPPVAPTGLINGSDADSRVVRTHGQPPLQGYNAHAAVNEHQVVAAEITVDSPDVGHLEPMVNATRRELRRHGLGDPRVVLADAGYWHQRQIEHVGSDGRHVLVAPDGGLRNGTRPGWDAGVYDVMRSVLATPEGRPRYRQRHVTVEPVLGQIKFNRAITRFHRRGRAACRTRWRLITATHHPLKLHNHRIAAATP
jgi:Transposase DDE domain